MRQQAARKIPRRLGKAGENGNKRIEEGKYWFPLGWPLREGGPSASDGFPMIVVVVFLLGRA